MEIPEDSEKANKLWPPETDCQHLRACQISWPERSKGVGDRVNKRSNSANKALPQYATE